MDSGKPRYVHPELEEGEVFLGNHTVPEFELIGWKTKRLGNVAYGIDGKSLGPIITTAGKRLYPVFAQRAELKAEGIDPDNLTW